MSRSIRTGFDAARVVRLNLGIKKEESGQPNSQTLQPKPKLMKTNAYETTPPPICSN